MAESNAPDQVPTPSPFARLAVIKAVIKAATAAEQAAKAECQDRMDPGDRKTAAIDGNDVGTITYAKASAKAVVTDRAAFTEWVVNEHPTEVTTRITVDADHVLAALNYQRHRDLANDQTGPIGDDAIRLAIYLDEHPKALNIWRTSFLALMDRIQEASPQVNPAYEDMVLRGVVKAKAPVDPKTGEMIPGVEYQPGGEGTYVSARVSEDQAQRIADLYAAGDLDLFAVAMTEPAAIEAE